MDEVSNQKMYTYIHYATAAKCGMKKEKRKKSQHFYRKVKNMEKTSYSTASDHNLLIINNEAFEILKKMNEKKILLN